MKTLVIETPYRYGGIMQNFEMDAEQWSKVIPEMSHCYKCGRRIKNAIKGKQIIKNYPYAMFLTYKEDKKVLRGAIEPLCRSCAYSYKLGVLEMDGEEYQCENEFNEEEYKQKIKVHDLIANNFTGIFNHDSYY